MTTSTIIITAVLAILSCVILTDADKCPKSMPLKIDGKCFRFQTDPLRYKDARDNCPKLDSAARMATVRSKKLLDEIEKLVFDFVLSKLENAVFWIGLYMDDRSMSKAVEDRDWKWNYDDSKFVQKTYDLWETEGGPKKKGLTCATINASNNFLVKPVDCGGPRVPVICMMNEGEKCRHDVAPYLTYGDYCIASLNGALEYNKILGACSPNAPTPYKDEMRESVIMAAKNSFLGGGLYMNIQRFGDRFLDLTDYSEPDPDWWEEGEPRAEYDCVGLSLQTNNKLKLKTMNCEFFASSLCVIGEETNNSSSTEAME